jgi:plasmid stability protein
MEPIMGIVNIDDDLHDRLRVASKVSCRSVNAQAAWWIKIGMLCEASPALSFTEIVEREMRAAGLPAPALPQAADAA